MPGERAAGEGQRVREPGAPEEELARFPDELAHLEEIREKLELALEEADADVHRRDREYMDAKRYMAQNRGEIDPHEMFQNQLSLGQLDSDGAFAVRWRDQMRKLREAPYFARIDFRETGCRTAERCYIGRFAFSDESGQLIFDWRSPVAGMFYDYPVGPAGYLAPVGRVEGTLTRKRQFQLRNGVLELVLESADTVRDDVLQRELSRTADQRMKSIIGTIQREQNAIIREEQANILIIQGVAGSGKTSVALHRVAYLLYRLRDRLAAGNVAILSPNRVFGDYIAGVLPELGEEPIFSLGFEELARVQLEGIARFEPDRDPLAMADPAWAERTRFKSTGEFVQLLDCYLEGMPEAVFAPADYGQGRFGVSADWLWERYRAYGSHPVMSRLERMADDLHDRFQSANLFQEELPTAKHILGDLKRMLSVKSSLALYREFYRWAGCPRMLAMPGKNLLEWGDVYPFLYLHAAFAGLAKSGVIRHLVVDEMQDYTPVQYAVLARIFHCPMTILGDYGQRANPLHAHSLEDLRRRFPGAKLVRLGKSYRSTWEITVFARRIQRVEDLEPVERHGEAPRLVRCRDDREQLSHIREAVAAFGQSGLRSLGILLKTDREAKALHHRLAGEGGIELITPESKRFAGGVSVASVRMAKGLEFDAVVIPDADGVHYCSEADRSLLYIACTRAMHRLTLLHVGEPTPLIGPEEEE